MQYYKIDHSITFEDIEKFNVPNKRVGVIIHIEDEEGKILLQQRGLKSRDEQGLYEDVGGKLEENERDFKKAIEREMKEEMGECVQIKIEKSVGIFDCEKKENHWIFVIFYGRYIGGEIKIMEPEKCLGYKFFNYEEAVQSKELSESCKFLIKAIKE